MRILRKNRSSSGIKTFGFIRDVINIRVLLSLMMAVVFFLSAPISVLHADAANFLKKNNIRTNMRLGKTVDVQSYCYGLGLRDSKVKLMELKKEDSKTLPGYEKAYVKVRVTTPKLKKNQIKKVVDAALAAGFGNNISTGYNGLIIDGNNGMSICSYTTELGQVDGVYSACTMSYGRYYNQKAEGYEIQGCMDLIYEFTVVYPKERKNIYVGIAGEKAPDLCDLFNFEARIKKFTKTKMYNKKNNKLSAFIKLN